MTEEKAKSKSVSFSPALWETVEKISADKYGGNRSAYLREIVEKDLHGLSVGTPQSAYTVGQLSEMLRAEAALLRAERIAREYLLADDSKRAEIARELCTHLLDVTRRSPTYPETRDSGNALAAEGPGLPVG